MGMASLRLISLVILSMLAGASLARACQARSRRASGAYTLSMPISRTPRRMNGATLPGKSSPCAMPQAATVPP